MMSIWDPGFYLLGHVIPIPKLFAVPLTLAASMLLTWRLGLWGERRYRLEKLRRREQFSPKALQHRFFTLTTFLAFNFFFIFAGRSWVLSRVLPALSQTQRQQLYRDMLHQLHQYDEANGALGQLMIQNFQQQLGITAEHHEQTVAQLGLEENNNHRRAALMRAIAALSPSNPPRAFPMER